jgi:hypothetical protein
MTIDAECYILRRGQRMTLSERSLFVRRNDYQRDKMPPDYKM